MAGTVYKRAEGVYRLQVSMGSDETGTPLRFTKTVHAHTKKEAEKDLAQFYIECEKKVMREVDDCKLSEFADLWWKEYVELYTKQSTRGGYETAVYYRVVPALGKINIGELKSLHIQKWVNKMKEEGLSPKTIKNYFSVLNSMCNYAVKWDYILSNPCSKVTLPKRVKTEANYYEEKDVRALIEALENTPENDKNYKTAIYIALFGGLRKGEILGLNEADYSSEKRKLRITRTRMLGRKIGTYEDTPKTEKSVRTVSIPEELAAKIDELIQYNNERKKMWGSKWGGSKALIKGINGQAMYPQNLQRWFTRFVEKNKLPYLTLHGLRHTHTALLASMSDDITQISRRLGHSDITTTLNIYTHLFRNDDDTLATGISEKFLAEATDETETE